VQAAKGLQPVFMLYFGSVWRGWRQTQKPSPQEALNLTLPVEHGYPVLGGDDRQIQPLGQVGAWYQIERRDGACLNLKNQILKI
jgi:hypothetical protein